MEAGRLKHGNKNNRGGCIGVDGDLPWRDYRPRIARTIIGEKMSKFNKALPFITWVCELLFVFGMCAYFNSAWYFLLILCFKNPELVYEEMLRAEKAATEDKAEKEK